MSASELRVDSIAGGTYIVRKENDRVHITRLIWQPLRDATTPHPAQAGPRAEIGGIHVYPVPTMLGDDVRVIGQHVYVSMEAFTWLRNAQSMGDLPPRFKDKLGEAVTDARAATFTVDDSVTKFLQELQKKGP